MPDGTPIATRASTSLLGLPNLITLARLCAVPLAFWLVIDRAMGSAFGLFVAAGASDAVDGWLARRAGVTRLGAVLDPVADKALLVTMYVTLAAVGVLPSWLATLVVFRDLVIVGGIVVLAQLGQPVAIRPLFVSKVNTVLQIVLVAFALFLAAVRLFGPAADAAMLALVWTVAASTLVSGVGYVWRVAHGR